jgi:hypothetical protein
MIPGKIDRRLAELGLELPPALWPLNSCQHVVIVDELAVVAGPSPLVGGEHPSSLACGRSCH